MNAIEEFMTGKAILAEDVGPAATLIAATEPIGAVEWWSYGLLDGDGKRELVLVTRGDESTFNVIRGVGHSPLPGVDLARSFPRGSTLHYHREGEEL